VGGLGRVVGPIWAGFLFQAVAMRSPFYLATAFILTALVLTAWIPARLQSRSRRSATLISSDPQTKVTPSQ
jgi:MFS family permease